MISSQPHAKRSAADHAAVFIVDDDADDCMLMRKAFQRNDLQNPLTILHNGEELLNHLRALPTATKAARPRLPGLIILDLNMPVMDGRETLQELKSDPALRHIPVIIVSSSAAPEDVHRMYDLGVNAYMTKPVTFDTLVQTVHCLSEYWLKTALIPSAC
ncbi:MAG: response regulator [Verrucomicrobiota bacterium JB022]|nr:response regulator [Verrucomicrobiota bacterium JB022]